MITTNKIICYICNQVLSKKELEEAEKVKDINGNDCYKHKKGYLHCFINYKLGFKPRKSDTLNKRTHIEEDKTQYNRNKEKINFKKELKDEI